MTMTEILFLVYYILCALSIVGMVFIEHKKPIRITAWSLVLIIFPFVGLLMYILIGYGLGSKTKLMLKKRTLYNTQYNDNIKKQISSLEQNEEKTNIEKKHKDIIMLNLNNANTIFSSDNDVEMFSDGKIMLENLKKDLQNAKKTINILFYIFANDKIGKEVKEILTQKSKEGVKVKVLYDAVGSLFTHKFQFRKLIKAGGEVQEFFPAFMGIKFFNLRANYRNHRKIVVIDGKVAYTGGMNIRADHMGEKKKVSPWRDCHLRIVGSAVYSLQNIFISDWRVSKKIPENQNYFLNTDYFSSDKFTGKTCLQIISSGPTNKDEENIEELMIKMIMSAKKNIRIQTPYFIPNEAFLSALKIASLSGIKVEIMVPNKPDKYFVYLATLSYLKDAQKLGAKIYLYNGFMHTKAVKVDDDLLTIGSCNIDIRSFELNFEVNTLLYSEIEAKKYNEIFENDIDYSEVMSDNYFKKINFFKKLALSVARIFSAIM